MDIISGITGLVGGLVSATGNSSEIDTEIAKIKQANTVQWFGIIIAIGLGVFSLAKAIKK